MAHKRHTKPKPKSQPRQMVYGALIDTSNGQMSLVTPQSSIFDGIARHLSGMSGAAIERSIERAEATVSGSRRTTNLPWYMGAGGIPTTPTAYQRLTGNFLPSLRQRLAPWPDDYIEIVDRVDLYRKYHPWLNRMLVLRSALNASEFRIDAPGNKEQTKWMQDLKRGLRMFSYMREFFWNLRAYGQVIPLWRTAKKGRDPISIECANPKVYQPRFNPLNGVRPNIVVIPANDVELKKLIEEAQGVDDNKKKAAEKKLKAYPKPLVEALRDAAGGVDAEVPAEELEEFGLHFEYTAYDRRHWEDQAFPGMFSIFPYLEMLMLADDADINALHHYKAGILLVRLGPKEPRAGDADLIATEGELKAIDKKLVELAKARLPGWAARGDLTIEWVVPPDHIINSNKVASAKEKVLDWLGIPKIAYAGQDFSGAFAAAQVTLKFLQGESKDERAIAREMHEEWFYIRSKASNAFEGAEWPYAWFDPNVLLEQRIVMEMARMFLQFGGADMKTIAESLDQNADVWASRRDEVKQLEKEHKINFEPLYQPKQQAGGARGRPATVGQPTPESGGGRQARPSTSEAVIDIDRVVDNAHKVGLDAETVRAAIEQGIVDE